jgi:hypothetical protein
MRQINKDTDSEEESDEDEENLGPEDGEEGCEDEYDALDMPCYDYMIFANLR